MLQLIAIARNAFIETVRQPIFFVLLLVTFLTLVFDVPLANYTMGHGSAEYAQSDQQWLITLGLSTLLVSGLFIAAFSAAGVLAREIEDKTVLTVISKPVGRPTLLVGKFAGVAAGISAAFYICGLVFLMTVRHGALTTAGMPADWPVITLGCGAGLLALAAAVFGNYFFGWNFISAAVGFTALLLTPAMLVIAVVGKGWSFVPFGEGISGDVVVSMLLIFLGVLVFTAVAVAASSRLGQVMTLLVCVGFFIVGSMSPYLFNLFASEHVAAGVAYRVWPNLTFFYTLDALQEQGRTVPMSYFWPVALYAVCEVAAILAVGVILFQRRELEAVGNSASAPRTVSLLAWLFRGGAIVAGLAAVLPPAYAAWWRTAAYMAELGVAAVAAWLFSGLLGRGVRWTYPAILLLTTAAVAGLIYLAGWRAQAGSGRLAAVTGLILTGMVWLALVTPKTRAYFGLAGKTAAQPAMF